MTLVKKELISLADAIRRHNEDSRNSDLGSPFDEYQIDTLADYCASQNPRFDRGKWLGYIYGVNGPNGERKEGTK